MRNLTIKRAKSFVGCLAKMKIYIEDPAAGDTEIGGVSCRRLGELKNGEEKTFSVCEQAAKVFVIADSLSKGYCSEYYQLADGSEDICLSGKNKFDPAAGNAFRFDSNDSAEVAAYRKGGKHKGLPILIGALVAGCIIGVGIGFICIKGGAAATEKAKTFSAAGMQITLTDSFRETDTDNFTVAYDSAKAAVFALREPFTLMDGMENNDLMQYADLVINANSLGDAAVKTADGLTWFEYSADNTELNTTYCYYAYVYKAADAFWLVQFVAAEDDAAQYAPQFAKWAKTVTFS